MGVFCAIEYLDKVLPFSKKQWQLFRRFHYSHNSWYNTKQQLVSQKYTGFVFGKYLGELIPRIYTPLKTTMHSFWEKI